MTHRPGDVVVWRTVVDGRVRTAIPHRCVADDGERLVLWRPHGTVYKRPTGPYGAGPRGRSLHAARWDGTYRDLVWTGDAVLLHRRGDWHSVLWLAPQRCWYVNLEAAWTPCAVGYDSRDLMLDVVVAEDLSSWEWKDIDEAAEAVDDGRIGADDLARARQEGEVVAAAAMRGEPPFTDGWDAWAPDPAWPVPEMPEGWDRT